MTCKNALFILGAVLALAPAIRAVASPPAQATGKVLVLDNGRTLDGDIERHGDQYRISREMGEVWLPATPDMKLCSDWREAYEFMASRTNLLDPDERLRLARWCHLRGLREEARVEATAAVNMRPEHVESKQLLSVLERTLVMGQNSDPAATPLPPAPPPPSDISSDSVALFITRVQPILMNTCVSCHSNGKGGNFQLYRSYHGGTQAATQKNLAAVLAEIDTEHPILSTLLIKAVSAHGNGGQPPLKSRHTVPYRALQEWVDHVIRNNPHLQKKQDGVRQLATTTPDARTVPTFPLLAPAAMGLPRIEARQLPREAEEKSETVKVTAAPRVLPHLPSTPLRSESPPINAETPGANPSGQSNPIQQTSARTPVVAAAKLPQNSGPGPVAPSTTPPAFSSGQGLPTSEPADPFDPAIFNRQVQPKR